MNRRPDLFSLSMGVLFMIVGMLFAVDQLGWLRLNLQWFVPVALLVVGGGLAAGGFRRFDRDPD